MSNKRRWLARAVVPTQREVLRDVMLSAARYGAWMTLRELSRLTGYGEASISAQLRHLRRKEYGGFLLRKRLREPGVLNSAEHFFVWEYRLSRIARRSRAKRNMRRLVPATRQRKAALR